MNLKEVGNISSDVYSFSKSHLVLYSPKDINLRYVARYFQVLSVIILGLISFFLVVDPNVLIPTNIAWLTGGDPAASYLGWSFFRNSGWAWPLGLNPNYGLEISSAIIYSDSNPLLALAFKPFSVFLPKPFQYFGLWLLACFVLQALAAWKLLGLISNNFVIRFLGAGLFVFCPSMLFRLPAHPNLVGHFFIVAALYLALRSTALEAKDCRNRFFSWGLLLLTSVAVHAYIFAMVAAIWLADLFGPLLKKRGRNIKAIVLELLLLLLAIACVCWQVGYFSVKVNYVSSEFGFYRMNMLSFLDSDGWSYLLKDLPAAGNGEYEGFNYFGLGTLFLLSTGFTAWLARFRVFPAIIFTKRPLVFVALFLLTIYSISNHIGLGPLEFKIGDVINISIIKDFRANGRMFWPVVYAVIFTSIYLIERSFSQRATILLLSIVLIVQVIDTSAVWKTFRDMSNLTPSSVYVTPFKDSFWAEVASRYTKVRRLSQSIPYFNIATYADRYGLATDSAYVNRIDQKSQHNWTEHVLRMCSSGKYDADSFYFISIDKSDPQLLTSILATLDTSDLVTRIDGAYVLLPGWKTTYPHWFDKLPEIRLKDILKPLEANRSLDLKLGNADDTSFFYFGWHPPEPVHGMPASGKSAKIMLPISDKIASIKFEMWALVYPHHPEQRLSIKIADQSQSFILSKAFGNLVEIVIPDYAQAEMEKKGYVHLEFDLPDAITPQELGINKDTRLLSIGITNMVIQ
jgi:hypothetical protein